MGATPQTAPTIQSTVADPNFQKLSADDRIAVLGHLDSNFRGLKPDVQLEVMSHLMQGQGTQATIGAPPPPKNISTGDSTQKAEGTVQKSILGEDVRTAAPYVGAAAASLALGPEAGLAARMGAAALGGGVGSVASHAIPGGTQPPLLSGAGALDVGEDMAKQAAFELGSGLIGKGIGSIVGRFTSRVPVDEAAAKIADTLSPNLTPSEFGEKLRSTITNVRSTLGAQKGAVLDDIIKKFPIADTGVGAGPQPYTISNAMGIRWAKTPGLPDISIPNKMAEAEIPAYVAEKQALQAKGTSAGTAVAAGPKSLSLDNTTQAVNQAINTLQAEKRLTPSLFAAGEAKSRTLNVLQDIQRSLTSISPGTQQTTSPILDQFGRGITGEEALPIPPHFSTIKDLDTLRSSLFQLGKGIDRPLPKGVVGQLTHAVHNDIGDTLGQFGQEGRDAFGKFEAASSKFRETQDILDTSTFLNVMKANVNQPEKLLNILMQAPETNIERLGTILQNSTDGPAVTQSMRHLALERAASSPQGFDSIPGPAKEVVFGKDLPKVQQFFDAVDTPNNTGMVSRVTSAANMLAGHPGAMMTNWVFRSGPQTASISGPELAVLLGNPTTRQLLLRAAQTPASGQASALLLRALGAYIEMPTAPAQPVTPPPQAGASIGDQLKSKGVQLPQASPNQAGMPFHPGSGL